MGDQNELLPPANEVWGKVIFLHLSVILFTGGAVPWQVPSGRYTPQAGSPLLGRYTPPGRYTPWAGTPPGRYTPHQCMLGYGQQAVGTHPTGMHSCSAFLFTVTLFQDLITLRNNTGFGFWFVNMLWVIFNYMVQKDNRLVLTISGNKVHPLGFIFLVIFMAILCLQVALHQPLRRNSFIFLTYC